MAHILTEEEAVGALRLTDQSDVPTLEMLLDAVDDGIEIETGRDWAADESVSPTAKLAAMLLLISLNDGVPAPVAYGFKIAQLSAVVKTYEV